MNKSKLRFFQGSVMNSSSMIIESIYEETNNLDNSKIASQVSKGSPSGDPVFYKAFFKTQVLIPKLIKQFNKGPEIVSYVKRPPEVSQHTQVTYCVKYVQKKAVGLNHLFQIVFKSIAKKKYKWDVIHDCEVKTEDAIFFEYIPFLTESAVKATVRRLEKAIPLYLTTHFSGILEEDRIHIVLCYSQGDPKELPKTLKLFGADMRIQCHLFVPLSQMHSKTINISSGTTEELLLKYARLVQKNKELEEEAKVLERGLLIITRKTKRAERSRDRSLNSSSDGEDDEGEDNDDKCKEVGEGEGNDNKEGKKE